MTVYEVLTSGAKWSIRRTAGTAAVPVSKKRRAQALREEAAAILEEVGLSAADLERRPAEFSGGQRQRISIARGLIMKPDLLICDEVVSALDISIQGQILNLLLNLRSSRLSSGNKISFLFIAHDLKVASYFCDRIGVMYQGEIMEEAPAAVLWKNILHPYTDLLFSSVQGRTPEISGQTPSSAGAERTNAAAETRLHANEGCAFAPRCPHAEAVCFREKPALQEAEPGHLVRCQKN
jgi:oligopeptide/dipeptide ABC transporter ATP-binding protein